MKNIFLKTILSKQVYFIVAVLIMVSCNDLEQEFENERFLTNTHSGEISSTGGTVVLESIDGAIAAFFRDGYTGTDRTGDDEFGLKAVELGLDLMGDDMDMNNNTWFGGFSTYDNKIPDGSDNEFIWTFFNKIIGDSNSILSSIPEDSTDENLLVFKGKALTYRAISFFYLLRIYQHTKAADSELAIPLNLGQTEPQPLSTVGVVKKQILDDLTEAYELLKDYDRASVQEVGAPVVAAFLARYHLTYENWSEAESFADIAMKAGSIDDNVLHGYESINIPEAIWASEVTATTTQVYNSWFSHASNVNDGYGGWNHVKTVSSKLYDQIPDTDQRKLWFTDKAYAAGEIEIFDPFISYYPLEKYTGLKFYSTPLGAFEGDYIFLRNVEFYLTKAEAAARQGKDADAQDLLFELNSKRDPNYTKSTSTGQTLIDEILLYRQIELWGEGVRYFDLARLGKGVNREDGRENDRIEEAIFSTPAMDDDLLFPIPESETDANPNIDG